MKNNRRYFIKKSALSLVAISPVSNLSILSERSLTKSTGFNNSESIGTSQERSKPVFSVWEVSFDEKSSSLSLVNGQVEISGQLSFMSDDNKWKITNSRDGIQERYALVDNRDNAQGYLVVNKRYKGINLLFYHRTAQSFKGVFSYEGNIKFLPESFACRTKASTGERVLSLSSGSANSLLNDSLFAPNDDTVLQLGAEKLHIKTESKNSYSFFMSGLIQESSNSTFYINLERDYFKNRYAPYYNVLDRKRVPKTPTGWMSWNTYFDKATAEDNLAEAKIGQKYLQPFGCEFWSIESWQGNSDQLPVRDFYNMDLEVNNKQFPKGMKQLADDIRKLGFRPGLWMAPFGTGNNKFYESHKKWFLHDIDGNPIPSWNGRYTLDPTVFEAREHLKDIFRKASREWGYEFFKIDGMSGRDHGYGAHLYERPEIKKQFMDPQCENPFELCVKAFRDGIGEDRILLACQGHSSGPEAFYADAARLGADIVHADQPVQWSNVYNQARCTLNQVFTHNIVMIADPDTLLVHDLPLEEARVTTTVVSLPGQLNFFGDKLAALSDMRMKMLQQTLPVADVRPMSLYPYFSMLPVWSLNIHHEFLGEYNVVALFNWEDKIQEVSFTTEELGVDSDAEYLLYEFWTEKYFGVMKESFAMDIPARGVRLLAMHKRNTIPQWISSDRHVTQNAMELKSFKWNLKNNNLEGKIQLVGSFTLTMRLYLPDGYSISKVDCSGAKCSTKHESKNILAVTFKPEKTGEYFFNLGFK